MSEESIEEDSCQYLDSAGFGFGRLEIRTARPLKKSWKPGSSEKYKLNVERYFRETGSE
jgi:hypothetical protein